MEPIAALGVASNVIQIADFTARLISNTKEIYHSTDGTLQAHRSLQQAAEKLQDLSNELQRKIAGCRTSPSNFGSYSQQRNLSTSDKQLLQLTEEARDLTKAIHDAIRKSAIKNSKSKWLSIRQALRAVWTQKEFSDFEEKLNRIQKNIDTVTLVSIR